MEDIMEQQKTSSTDTSDNDRREFLKKCGKYAAITPPAVTMLLSTSLTSKAIAGSTGGPPILKTKGNNGWGNGGSDGTNKGSLQGNGVSGGGQGKGQSQGNTKGPDKNR